MTQRCEPGNERATVGGVSDVHDVSTGSQLFELKDFVSFRKSTRRQTRQLATPVLAGTVHHSYRARRHSKRTSGTIPVQPPIVNLGTAKSKQRGLSGRRQADRGGMSWSKLRDGRLQQCHLVSGCQGSRVNIGNGLTALITISLTCCCLAPSPNIAAPTIFGY